MAASRYLNTEPASQDCTFFDCLVQLFYKLFLRERLRNRNKVLEGDNNFLLVFF